MSWEVKIIDGVPVKFHTVVVHRFTVSDVDDPDLFAGEPIWQWQQSEVGKWVMEKATDKPSWHRQVDYNTYGYQYAIKATFKEQDYTYFLLKWK